MSYYLEVWLRGFAKDYLREISIKDEEFYHPHVTLVRPFNITSDEESIKNRIITFCNGKSPIPFSLEGQATFEGNINYVPVINCSELLQFDNCLEQILSDDVQFVKKLNNKKIPHATINVEGEIPPYPKIEQYMLRLTGIKDKKIWFSWDFVTQKELDREESLDQSKWYQTVHQFTEKSRLLPTRKGYQKID
tara:strand:+ start:468 stop:1043 length:576 start_codon:yes stop_codon:yes gene_type:complete